MRIEDRTVTTTTRVWISETRPDLVTEHETLAATLAWLDANPDAYRVVTTKRSKTFGLGSSTYLACGSRGMGPADVIYRLNLLMNYVAAPSDTIHDWRARFTLAHVRDKRFRGGFFQQWDDGAVTNGRPVSRSCLHLDYTPETLVDVVARFRAWMDPSFRTTKITIDGRVAVWTLNSVPTAETSEAAR